MKIRGWWVTRATMGYKGLQGVTRGYRGHDRTKGARKPSMMDEKMTFIEVSERSGVVSMWQCRTMRGGSACLPPPGGPHAARNCVSATFLKSPTFFWS